MSSELEAAWNGIQETKPDGWHVGRPCYDEQRKGVGAARVRHAGAGQGPVIGRGSGGLSVIPNWRSCSRWHAACARSLMGLGLTETTPRGVVGQRPGRLRSDRPGTLWAGPDVPQETRTATVRVLVGMLGNPGRFAPVVGAADGGFPRLASGSTPCQTMPRHDAIRTTCTT
jgi:hypothetical protein